MLDQILDLFSFVESRLSNDKIAVNDTPINNDKGTWYSLRRSVEQVTL